MVAWIPSPRWNRFVPLLAACSLALLGAGTASASVSRDWSVEGVEAFAAGELDGTVVDSGGKLRLARSRTTIWGPAPGIVWDLDLARDGRIWVALSEPSSVLLVGGGKGPETWLEEEPGVLVTAVTSDGARGMIAGLSPGGELVRVGKKGVSAGRSQTGSSYIWDLLRDPDGTLWIATGSPGAVMRSDHGGEPETVFESGDDPVRCLALLPDGNLAAGTGSRGRVLKIDRATGSGFVLFDTGTEEVVSLAVDSGGVIYALTSGNAPSPEKSAGSGSREKDASSSKEPVPRVTTRVIPAGELPAAAEGKNGGKTGGALYRIEPGGDVVKIWTAGEELPYAVAALSGGRTLVATGPKGRILELSSDGTASVFARIPSGKAARLLSTRSGGFFLAGNSDARIEQIGSGLQEDGSWRSRPVDAGWIADWGRVAWEGEISEGTDLLLEGRVGNSAEPDSTWTRWRPLKQLESGEDLSRRFPPARWFQLRLKFSRSPEGAGPAIRRLQVHYRPRNRAPRILDLRVLNPGLAKRRGTTQSSSRYGLLTADDPVARDARSRVKGSGKRNSSHGPIRRSYEPGVRTFEWDAVDPDGDGLSASIELRKQGETTWFPLASDLKDRFLSWDARGMPDGEYRIRLTVDDRPGNPDPESRSAVRLSGSFILDGTPPRLTVDREGDDSGREIYVTVEDATSGIRALEVSVNGGEWKPMAPVDGVSDSSLERFKLPRVGAESGPQKWMLRASDRAGNLAVEMVDRSPIER